MENSQFVLNAAIEDVHWWFKARRDILFEGLKRFVPPFQGKTVVEIGCGTGGNLKFFSSYYRVMGTDVSPEAVSYARDRVEGAVFLGDYKDALADKWQDIDAVLLPDVLEHVADDAAFLQNIVAHMKPGAVLAITVPLHDFLWSRHDVILGHKRRYSVKRLRALWSGLPVLPVFSSRFNSFLFPLIACYRLLPKGGSAEKRSDTSLPPPWVNTALCMIFSLERYVMRIAALPLGVSYLLILKKT